MKKNNTFHFKGLIDTTLRDGQQSPLLFDTNKYRFSLDDKKSIVKALITLGVRYIEFFSPIVSTQEEKDFLTLKEYIKKLTSDKVYLLAHCRCHENDITKAIDAGFDGVNLYLGATTLAQKYSVKKDFDQIISMATDTIIKLRKQHPTLYIRFSVEDSFRIPLTHVYKIYDKLYGYVDTFGMPDTVGIATPAIVTKRVKALKKRYPKVNLECHFHNDRGYALVNAIAAVEAGIQFVDTSIWGLAERSGITTLTGFLLNVYYINKNICKLYNVSLCYPLNVLMGSILNTQVPYNEPVSLTNRTHIAGVHQNAAINNKKVYEANALERFGVTKNQFLLGPLSGWHLIHYFIKEIKGYDITVEQAKVISKNFKNMNESIHKQVNPEQLLDIVLKNYSLKKVLIPSNLQKRRVENFL